MIFSLYVPGVVVTIILAKIFSFSIGYGLVVAYAISFIVFYGGQWLESVSKKGSMQDVF